MSNPMDVEDVVERVREIADSQQHIDSDFARSTNATGDLRQAASLLTSQAERIAELEKERDEAAIASNEWMDAAHDYEARLEASEDARLKLVEALRDTVESLETTLKPRFDGWECSDDDLLGKARSLLQSEEQQKDQQS